MKVVTSSHEIGQSSPQLRKNDGLSPITARHWAWVTSSQVKRPADRHGVVGFVIVTAFLVRRRAHQKRAVDPHEFHHQALDQLPSGVWTISRCWVLSFHSNRVVSPGAGIRYPDPGARPRHKLRPRGRHLKRAARKLHAIICGRPPRAPPIDGPVMRCAAHRSGIDLAARQGHGLATIEADRQVPALHFQPEMSPIPESLSPSPGISSTPWACAAAEARTTNPYHRRSKQYISSGAVRQTSPLRLRGAVLQQVSVCHVPY